MQFSRLWHLLEGQNADFPGEDKSFMLAVITVHEAANRHNIHTCKRVGDVIFDLDVDEDGREDQRLVLLVPQADVAVTWGRQTGSGERAGERPPAIHPHTTAAAEELQAHLGLNLIFKPTGRICSKGLVYSELAGTIVFDNVIKKINEMRSKLYRPKGNLFWPEVCKYSCTQDKCILHRVAKCTQSHMAHN